MYNTIWIELQKYKSTKFVTEGHLDLLKLNIILLIDFCINWSP